MAGPMKNLKDKDIINLLSRLKAAGPEYPDDLLSKRRAAFIAAGAAVLGGGAGGAASGGGGGAASAGGSGHAGTAMAGMSQIDKFVIALEVIVLTGMTSYLAVTAYVNRDYLKNLLFPSTPTAAMVQPVSTNITGSPESTASLIPTDTGTPTPTLTPEDTPTAVFGANNTPQPEYQPPPSSTNPGLHLGQTPHPTKKSKP
jgi:hypothetical protein